MRLFPKRTAREREIRRWRVESAPAWWRRLFGSVPPARAAMVAACAAVAALAVSIPGERFGLSPGQFLPRAITARVPIRLPDNARTEVIRVRAAESAPLYYTLDTSLLRDIRGRLASALRIAREQDGDPGRIVEAAAGVDLELDHDAAAELARLAASEPDAFERSVDRAIELLRKQPLVPPSDPNVQRPAASSGVLVDAELGTQREVSIPRLLFANVRNDVQAAVAEVGEAFTQPMRSAMRASLLRLLAESDESFKPLYRFDAIASAEASEAAARAVPPQYIEIPVDSKLADVGPLNDQEARLAEEEFDRYAAAADTDPNLSRAETWRTAARAMMAFTLVLLVGMMIVSRAEVARGGPHLLYATAATLMVVMLLSGVVYAYTPYPMFAVGIYAFAVILLAITSSRAPAQASAALLALVIALMMRQGVAFLVVLAAVAVAPFAMLRDVRHRGRIIAAGILTAASGFAAAMLVGLAEGQSASFVFWNRALWVLLSTLSAAFLVEGLLPGVERFFGVTTSMTLLEWCDPNKPLLRMMAAESPGTYSHSLVVGSLAQAAADSIGANGLLARAGAYYHDIGKINKPEYFVENQSQLTGNRHERLTPAMSHLVIVGHVKDGIAMAREYGVPEALHAFIPEHHGTCVVEYFYHAANKARKPDEPEISDAQFRYPGPKPQSKETAVLMICDSVEGAVRAMSEPTPARIEDTVTRITQRRLDDGQFDECDLTFREFATVRKTVIRTLVSIYHGRIRYPDEEETRPEPPAEPPGRAAHAS